MISCPRRIPKDRPLFFQYQHGRCLGQGLLFAPQFPLQLPVLFFELFVLPPDAIAILGVAGAKVVFPLPQMMQVNAVRPVPAIPLLLPHAMTAQEGL